MKKFIKSNTFYGIVSVIIAILLWIYAVYEVNPQYEMWIRNVPVSVLNVDSAFTNGNLEVVGENRDILEKSYKVDVKVKGKRNVVSSLEKKDIICTLDAKDIRGAGEYTIKTGYEVSKENVDVIKITPSVIKLSVEKTESKMLNIEIKTSGKLPEGFELENVSSKESVKVTGALSKIDNVSSAAVTLDCSSLSKSDTEKTLPVELFDENGNVCDSSGLTKTLDSVKVTFDLVTEREVKLVLYPHYKENNTVNRSGKNVKLSVNSPDANEDGGIEMKVKLRGTDKAISQYESGKTPVYTEEIDVSEIYYTSVLTTKYSAAPLGKRVHFVEVPEVEILAEVVDYEISLNNGN